MSLEWESLHMHNLHGLHLGSYLSCVCRACRVSVHGTLQVYEGGRDGQIPLPDWHVCIFQIAVNQQKSGPGSYPERAMGSLCENPW